MHHLKRFSSPLNSYIILTVLFFLLIAVVPVSTTAMHNYNMSAQQYRILLFMVELPLAFVWFAAFYSYAKLNDYAKIVSKTAEGHGFERLALGSKWLAWGLVLPTIISLATNGFANNHTGFHSAAIIVVNYLNVIFPIIAFSLISQGSHMLTVSQRLRPALLSIRLMMLAFIILGVVFCFLTFLHLDLHNPSSSLNPYYLPIWLLIFSVIIPYLYAWFVGLFAAQELILVARNVKGVLYRQALQLVASGVGLVVVSSIGVQYLRSVVPRTGHLALNTVLVTTYLIYLVLVLGFVLISMGANRLKKIEDI